MQNAATSWVILTLVIGLCAWIAIWSRRPTKARWFAVFAFLVGSPISAGALAWSLGWAVPMVDYVTLMPGKHNILAAKIIKDDGIYLFLDSGEGPPRYYRIPYDPKTASELQEKLDDKESGGTGVLVPPYENSFEQRRQFYALPQPKALPDKPAPQEEEKIPSLEL